MSGLLKIDWRRTREELRDGPYSGFYQPKLVMDQEGIGFILLDSA